ncbi:hypothetical protein T190607A02C_160088 [Tenacibaculum sp. 190524A02b]
MSIYLLVKRSKLLYLMLVSLGEFFFNKNLTLFEEVKAEGFQKRKNKATKVQKRFNFYLTSIKNLKVRIKKGSSNFFKLLHGTYYILLIQRNLAEKIIERLKKKIICFFESINHFQKEGYYYNVQFKNISL